MICFDSFFGPHLAQAAGVVFNKDADTVLCRIERGELLGGVLFTDYTGSSINLHVAGLKPNWINNDMLWATFHYAFVQLGCKVIIGRVSSGNSRALEFDKKLGFSEVARIDDVFPDGSLILLAMRREECRWLKLRPRHLKEPTHGQEEHASAPA
jgi:RimJ/RimL family protein N-acetyltransferase